MENASKALIIAGAILISIVIISLGIVVVNNVRGTATNANINSEEAQAFNAKFNLGKHLTGAQVNSIMQTVISENGANRADTDYTMIAVNFDESSIKKSDETKADYYIGTAKAMSDIYNTSDIKATVTTESACVLQCTFSQSKYFDVTASGYADNGYISKITVAVSSST